jgi:hypothetical protein
MASKATGGIGTGTVALPGCPESQLSASGSQALA